MSLFGLSDKIDGILPEIKAELVTNDGIIDVVEKQFLSDDYSERYSYVFNCSTPRGQLEAYKRCDMVTSLVANAADSLCNLKLMVVDNDKDKNPFQSEESDAIVAKINQPNPFQDFKLFHRFLESNIKIFGKAYVRKLHSTLFDEDDFYIIPNLFVSEFYKNEVDLLYTRVIDYYSVNDGTKVRNYSSEEIYIFYDGILDLTTGAVSAFGASRLESLSEVISAYSAAWEVRTELYGDGGARNLIGLGIDNDMLASMPKISVEKKELDNDIMKGYGRLRKQKKNLIVSTKAVVSPLTSPMSEMDIEATIKDAKKCLCTAYRTPAELFGVEGSRFKTIPEARKESYTQGVIPSAEYIISNWLKMLGKTGVPFRILPDFSHMDFYQESLTQKAIGFQQLSNAIVPLVLNQVYTAEEARKMIEKMR